MRLVLDTDVIVAAMRSPTGASAALLEAAQMLAQQPEAMQLRYLQTMTQVAGDRGSTIVFPLPMDLFKHLVGGSKPDSN